jgi:hypothetical protein
MAHAIDASEHCHPADGHQCLCHDGSLLGAFLEDQTHRHTLMKFNWYKALITFAFISAALALAVEVLS